MEAKVAGGSMASQLFRTLGWGVSPDNYMNAYAILLFWAIALLFTIIALSNAGKPTDAAKQKMFNYSCVWALVGLAFALFFAIRTVS